MTLMAIDERNHKRVVLASGIPNDVAMDLQKAMISSGRWKNVEIVKAHSFSVSDLKEPWL
jgi:hypothetical protein